MAVDQPLGKGLRRTTRRCYTPRPVFTETAGLHPAYIALCDWDNPSQLLVVQTLPLAASNTN
jgi:hypothetical protein